MDSLFKPNEKTFSDGDSDVDSDEFILEGSS